MKLSRQVLRYLFASPQTRARERSLPPRIPRKTLKEYKHDFVEECYYNEHFFIARKDNKLLVSYMQDGDNYIDNVIEHYFK